MILIFAFVFAFISFISEQAYNTLQTTLNAECALTQSEINETENAVRELEQNWNHLQV